MLGESEFHNLITEEIKENLYELISVNNILLVGDSERLNTLLGCQL